MTRLSGRALAGALGPNKILWNVRFAPESDQMLRRRERRDGPIGDT
jgi:hypothetical protein